MSACAGETDAAVPARARARPVTARGMRGKRMASECKWCQVGRPAASSPAQEESPAAVSPVFRYVRTAAVEDWSIPLVVATAAFLALLLWRMRPFIGPR